MKRRLKSKIIKYSMTVSPNPYGISSRDYSVKAEKGPSLSFSLTKRGLAKLPKGVDPLSALGLAIPYKHQGRDMTLSHSKHDRCYNRPEVEK